MERENYDQQVQHTAERVFEVMAPRVTPKEMRLIREAYKFACEAHKGQLRKSGHPYIIHPVAVALIAAEELKLDAASVMAAFLHDVVEDTPHTVDEIKDRFGSDVAFLVEIVTKKKKTEYTESKQVDNFKQLLDSVHYDIRALMVKLADRLHNMRTLSSMRPEKQMKIAGETDYFYAPLANRLGLFDVKTDLENLAFKYRCSLEYHDIERDLNEDMENNKARVGKFIDEINQILKDNGIDGRARAYYRRPYSIWRKMKAANIDFKHLENRYYIRVTFDRPQDGLTEKNTALLIYSLLTDKFKERPNSFFNQIDQPKENSYACIRVMLLSHEGIWEDVQICSKQMVLASKLGPMAELGENSNVAGWLKRFRLVLEDMANQNIEGNYMDSIVSSLYYDDIMVFGSDGTPTRLPKGASVLDYAFALDNETGLHAKYARINGNLASVKTVLKQGDCVEIGVDDAIKVKPDWINHVVTYNAKRAILHMRKHLEGDGSMKYCQVCKPIPGGDIIGFKDDHGAVTVHRRSCPAVIKEVSEHGDSAVLVDFKASPEKTFPVTVSIRAIDRYHLLIDIIEEITNGLKLYIEQLTTVTNEEIVDCKITFDVHSVNDLMEALKRLSEIDGVDAVHADGIR